MMKGQLNIELQLPSTLQVGIFQPGRCYPCWIRASTSTERPHRDSEKQIRGFAIKLLGVTGAWDSEGRFSSDEWQTQDLTFLSQRFLPLGTLARFQRITPAVLRWSKLGGFLWLLGRGRVDIIRSVVGNAHHDTSPLDIAYWSCAPYQFGEDRVVKYKLQPTSEFRSSLPAKLTDDYLKENLARHLAEHPASFDFMVQFYKDDASTPIDDASVEWRESVSPFIKVATLNLPVQAVNTPSRHQLADAIAFSPGNALMAHRPVGDLNLARVHLYRAMAHERRAMYGLDAIEQMD
jgi:catalase